MEDKEIVTSGKITQALIGNWLLWGIIIGFLYSIIFSLITSKIKSMILIAIITIIFQGIIVFIVWKISTASSFKKRTISYDEVPKVMKNLIIFTIIIGIINGIYNGFAVNSSINKALQANYILKNTETMISSFYNDNQMKEYQTQKDKMIKEVKSKVYTYLIILEIGLIVVYLSVLPLEKREILKYVRKE